MNGKSAAGTRFFFRDTPFENKYINGVLKQVPRSSSHASVISHFTENACSTASRLREGFCRLSVWLPSSSHPLFCCQEGFPMGHEGRFVPNSGRHHQLSRRLSSVHASHFTKSSCLLARLISENEASMVALPPPSQCRH